MSILHGSWLIKGQESCLFIWGETWRSLEDNYINISSINENSGLSQQDEIPLNPFAMTSVELWEWIQTLPIALPKSLQQSVTPESKTSSSRRTTKTAKSTQPNLPVISQIISLPSHVIVSNNGENIRISPIHSGVIIEDEKINQLPQYLQPWQVEGFCLKTNEAIKLLSSLPLNTASSRSEFIGADLRFWMQIYRWSLDLIARCKYLPSIRLANQPANQTQLNNNFTASWQALLDSGIDTTRIEKFSQLMPLACRTYQEDSSTDIQSPINVDLPTEPQALIIDFLNSTIDYQTRGMINPPAAAEARLIAALPTAVRQWLQGLTTAANSINANPPEVERLQAALKAWMMPLEYQMAGKTLFRICFELKSPEEGQNQWTLTYLLQASDDVEFLVDAATIWEQTVERFVVHNRTIDQPQETFLRGLGIASRLYSPIAESLETQSPTFCHLNPIQAYEFIKSVAWRLEDSGLGVILPPSLANREGWANRLGLKITAQDLQQKGRLSLQSLLNFQWQLAIGGQTISKAEFDRLVALNSPLVEINGEWVELRSHDIKTAQNFFASRKEQMSLSLEDALRLSSGDTQSIEKLPVVSFEASGALQELVNALSNNSAIAALPTPKDFKGELRPYQERGVAWLAFLERWGLGACLADDMGLGKTIQFIAFLLHLKEQNSIENPTLLVCPTSVLGNWEREVKKFAPTLKVLQYHGDKRPKGKAFESAIKKHDLLITSYSLVHRDIKEFQSVSWQNIVLDEAQNVKNADAKQSQAVRQLEANFRIALTGTPVENRLQELWSILDFLNPGYLGNKQFFQRRFAMPIEKYGDTSSLSQLRALVQPFILRRLKSDRDIIQDLPEKQEMTVFCGLTPEQAKLYQQVVENSLAEIDKADGLQRRGMILGLLIKLKQVCNHPAQYLKQDSLEQHNSAKLQRLEEMLDVALAEGDRALIFTQFAEWGKLLKPHLEKQLGREIFFLYGSTSKKQREEMIDRFQHDPQGPPIMILSLKAGGVGLNLTRANHVFHFDRWWNPAVENQATDRVFRIGQTRNVQVHKFVCTGTLEEKIHDMIESKKQLAEQVVGTGEDWLTELDTNQLRNLLLLDRSAVIEEE
ncbi:DEAD/DEAH box helicase [Brunnivagina elsteri]|uniref:ATP-dependent helicase n=1 Tax=Brunnivagina elsteri CCALA 953 TaxID=987040 RepID=A0A2A2TIQ5_9CYAN|nr:DEAD/DEAH box helicase [Calothrix elsteri]PAX54157.1 ATP-dependent helicase [Calothrix elsteri CCALA 953]